MVGKLAISLLTTVAAVAIAAISAHSHPTMGAVPGSTGLADADGDFLPDAVEWALLTSSTVSDTDGDQVSDFVEVVQKGRPREIGAPSPSDQEMRVVVTGPMVGSGDSTAWLHVFVRVLGEAKAIASFQSWIELPALPGIHLPFDILSLGPCLIAERQTATEGTWLSLSVPLVSTHLLQAVAPLSIHVESEIGGRLLRSSVSLLPVMGEIATLVPFGAGFALQSISPQPQTALCLSNRVCVLDLAEVGLWSWRHGLRGGRCRV